MTAIREATRSFYCEGQDPDPYVMWRYGAVASVVLANQREAGSEFNWAEGVQAFPRPVLIVAGTCGVLRAEVQERFNLGEFAEARVEAIEGAGHITLFTHHVDALLDSVRPSAMSSVRRLLVLYVALGCAANAGAEQLGSPHSFRVSVAVEPEWVAKGAYSVPLTISSAKFEQRIGWRGWASPVEIARAVEYLHRQDPRAWTYEMSLRPATAE